MIVPEPPTGGTTETHNARRYNSSDYDNPNRFLSVNVWVEIDLHDRIHSHVTTKGS